MAMQHEGWSQKLSTKHRLLSCCLTHDKAMLNTKILQISQNQYGSEKYCAHTIQFPNGECLQVHTADQHSDSTANCTVSLWNLICKLNFCHFVFDPLLIPRISNCTYATGPQGHRAIGATGCNNNNNRPVMARARTAAVIYLYRTANYALNAAKNSRPYVPCDRLMIRLFRRRLWVFHWKEKCSATNNPRKTTTHHLGMIARVMRCTGDVGQSKMPSSAFSTYRGTESRKLPGFWENDRKVVRPKSHEEKRHFLSQKKKNTIRTPSEPHQNPSKTHQNPIKTHQDPSKSIRTRQNPSKPHQNPSEPIRTH